MNSLSFTLFRTQYIRNCQLVTWRKARSARKMNYFVAGLLNQPQNAFRFLAKEARGGMTYVQFKSLGWSVDDTARQIAHDICKNGYKATIYTISVGDQVARRLEAVLGDAIQVVTINPCSHPRFLRPFFYYGSKIVAPLFQIACHLLLGWISAIPMIRAKDCNYSLILLADQMMAIAHNDMSHIAANTMAVVCSDNDEFLRNERIVEYFAGVPTKHIPTNHAQTVEKPNIYLDALRQLLKNNF